MTIYELERIGIHQTDFVYDNFIKFGNIFYMVDFGNAFFVKKMRFTNNYTDRNR